MSLGNTAQHVGKALCCLQQCSTQSVLQHVWDTSNLGQGTPACAGHSLQSQEEVFLASCHRQVTQALPAVQATGS